MLNSFNPELQLKNTESGIRNKLKDLLTELTALKFMAAMVLHFFKKKIEGDDNIATSIRPQKQELLLMK